MARLLIARHGNTFDPGDTITRVGARTDLGLSASGRTQAHALGRHLAAAGYAFEQAWCSTLRRTAETAAIVLAETGATTTAAPRAFLTEIDYGPDENRPEAEVVSRVGAEALARWESQGVPPPGWRVDPGALVRAWEAFLAEIVEAGAETLVVTSNGVARFVLRAGNLTVTEPPPSPRLRTGAYGEVAIEGGAVRLTSWDVRPPSP